MCGQPKHRFIKHSREKLRLFLRLSVSGMGKEKSCVDKENQKINGKWRECGRVETMKMRCNSNEISMRMQEMRKRFSNFLINNARNENKSSGDLYSLRGFLFVNGQFFLGKQSKAKRNKGTQKTHTRHTYEQKMSKIATVLCNRT